MRYNSRTPPDSLYQLTPSYTCIEGEWEQVMPLVHQCHELGAEVVRACRYSH
jgi:uncharacterized protein YqgV (UPF0045/DUF77 family)